MIDHLFMGGLYDNNTLSTARFSDWKVILASLDKHNPTNIWKD